MQKKCLVIISILLFFINVETGGKQKPEWRGKIVYKDGIKIVSNPKKPIFGEMIFELAENLSIGNEEDTNYIFYNIRDIKVDKNGNIYVLDSGNHRVQKFDKDGIYLQTIGQKGQGPGEFNNPLGLYIDSKSGNIYINDELKKIKIFDQEGNYINKDIVIEDHLLDFYIDIDQNVWGKFSWLSDRFIKMVKTKERNEKIFIQIPFKNTIIQLSRNKVGKTARARNMWIIHGYEHDLSLSQIDEKTFIYGYSKDYQLLVVNNNGSLLFKINKNEPQSRFTKSEKDKIKYQVRMDVIKRGLAVPNDLSLEIPAQKPFFYSIQTDCKGRIYICRNRYSREKNINHIYDIFSKKGYYLYKAYMKYYPDLIKDGFIYSWTVNTETGEEIVKRYRIINWEQIKSRIPG